MAFKYFNHNEIDKIKWDNTIQNSVNGIVYAYSWYLDIISPNWDALIENNYENVMPIPHNNKFGFKYSMQPFFCQQLGLFSIGKQSQNSINECIKIICDKFSYIKLNFNTLNNYNLKGFIQNQTFHLDLIQSYKILQKKYSENHKRNIVKANEKGIYIAKGVKPDLLIEMFKNDKGKEIKKLKEQHYNNLLSIMNVAIYKKIGEIFTAYSKNNTLLAAAFFILSNGKPIFLFSASTPEGKESRAMFLIINEFIKFYSEKNLTLDFEGSNNENLARFYSGFGATKCIYPTYTNNKLPFPLNLLKK